MNQLCPPYIHNWLLQPFSQNYDLASHVVCVKVDSERKIFEKFFMTILFTLIGFARNLLRECRRRNIFILMPDLEFEPKPSNYLLDYGDFIPWCIVYWAFFTSILLNTTTYLSTPPMLYMLISNTLGEIYNFKRRTIDLSSKCLSICLKKFCCSQSTLHRYTLHSS